MKKLLVALPLLASICLASPALAVPPVDQPVSGMTPASVLTGAEYIYCVQGGQPRRCSAFQISPAFGPAGVNGDGVFDNTAAIQAALTATQANGGVVQLPCGVFKVSSSLLANMSAGQSFRLRGSGFCTTLFGSGITAAVLEVRYGDSQVSAFISDLQITTDQNGSATAIELDQQTIGNQYAYAQENNIERVAIHGSDTPSSIGVYQHYFGNGILQWNVNNLNIDKVQITGNGNGGSGAHGVGLLMQGLVGSSYAVVTNVTNSNFNLLAEGIVYGDWYQGFTCTNCNLVGNNYGIFVIPNPTGLLGELSVTNSQFNNFVSDIGAITSGLQGLQLSNNYFIAQANVFEVELGGVIECSIVGNVFSGGQGGSTGLAIDGVTACAIENNTFYFLMTGISSIGTQNGLLIGHQIFKGNTTDMSWVAGSTTGFQFDDDTPRAVANLLPCNSGNTNSKAIVTGVSAAQTWNSAPVAGGSGVFKAICDPSAAWKIR